MNNDIETLTQQLADLLGVKPYELGYATDTQLKLSVSGLAQIVDKLQTIGCYLYDLDIAKVEW